MGKLDARLAKLEANALSPPNSIKDSGPMRPVAKYEGETIEEAIALAGSGDGRWVLLWSCEGRRSDWEPGL